MISRLLTILFTFFLFYCNAQIGSFRSGTFGTTDFVEPETLPALTAIPYTFTSDVKHHLARVDSPMVITLGIPGSYTINWAIIESESVHKPSGDTIRGDTLASGTGNTINYTFDDSHFSKSYDVAVDASWGYGGLSRWLGRRTIRSVLDSIYDEADPAVTTYDLSSASGFYTSPPATNRVIFKGSRASGSMYINNWVGVRVQFQTTAGTPAELTGNDGRLRIGSGNHNLHFDGCTDPDTLYAVSIHPTNLTDAVGVEPGALSTDFTDSVTFCGIYAYGLGAPFNSGPGTAFHIAAYQDGPNPGISPSLLGGYHVFNCRAGFVQNEDLYMGWTRDREGRTILFKPRYHNIYMDTCGWDNFQPGNSQQVEAHDLTMVGSGQLDNSNQYSTVSFNGVSGDFYHLYFGGGHKGFTGSTGHYYGNINLIHSYITSKPYDYGEALEYNWYRLGDGTFQPDSTVYFFMQGVTIDSDTDPIGFYCNGCVPSEGDSLNYKYTGLITPQNNYTEPTGTFLANTPELTTHWLYDFDSAGYRSYGEPGLQASAVSFSNVTTTGFTISWTKGNGNGRIVLIKQGSAVDVNPVDGTTYTASASFGSGDEIGTGNYVVYLGSGDTVSVTGLSTGTAYHVRVFEKNGSGASIDFLTSTGTDNPDSQITD